MSTEKTMRPLVAMCMLVTWPCLAQMPDKAGVGSVTGHVICADTRLPARMASVTLVPMLEATPARKSEETRQPENVIVQTLLDGSFTMSKVKPGKYYVVAEKEGYVSPLGQITRAEMNHPSAETAALMVQLLTPVMVSANRVASVDVRILHGGAISGTARYDDGTPASGTVVSLLTKGKDEKWIQFQPQALNAGTFNVLKADDLGQFRVSGLPAGHYAVQLALKIDEMTVSSVFDQDRSSSVYPKYTLNVYSGSVIRKKDAVAIDVAEGQDTPSITIEVPLTKLHSVTGGLTEGNTGRLVNAGLVGLYEKDDDTLLASTNVNGEDNQFHFFYVPEGNYVLKVSDAREVTRNEVMTCKGCMPATRIEEKTVRKYGPAEQDLVVQTDITGVNVGVPPQDETVKTP